MTVFERSDIDGWQQLMKSIAQAINKATNGAYVLKGGTGLLFGYQLSRHSVDLDFDAKTKKDISNAIKKAAEEISGEKVFIRKSKDTDTVQRFFLHLGSENTHNPLKIETSFRRRNLNLEKETIQKDGINIYKIATLAELKLQTIVGTPEKPGRMKARDIFDANFLFTNYQNAISPTTGLMVSDVLENKGINALEAYYKESATETDGNTKILAGKNAQDIVLNLFAKVEAFCQRAEKDQKLAESKALKEKTENIEIGNRPGIDLKSIDAETQRLHRDNKAIEESIAKYDTGLAIYMIAQKTKMEKMESSINNKMSELEPVLANHESNKPGFFTGRKAKEAWQKERINLQTQIEKLRVDKKKILAAKNEENIIDSFRDENPELTNDRDEAAQEIRIKIMREQDNKMKQIKEMNKSLDIDRGRTLSLK